MNRLAALCAGLALLAGTAYAQKIPSPSAPMTLSGPVHNVSVGVGGQVQIAVTAQKKVLTAVGSFSGLFGLFTASGRALSNCAKGHECLFFTGSIRFDPQNGGWPAGTATTFTMTVNIQPGGQTAAAVYHIGALEGFDHPQYGTMTLKVAR